MLIHIVKNGDTLSRIARQYDVSVPSIVSVNSIPDADRLAVGEALVIPTEEVLHTVRAGNTLAGIAQAYGSSVQAIVRSNRIGNPDSIMPGQVLRIPAVRYIVRPGDTLQQIAQRYGVPLERLRSVNGLEDTDLIYPGSSLIIPLRRSMPAIDVNGYIYILGQEAADILQGYGDYLTYMCPFAYLIREDGSLQPPPDGPAILTAYNERIVPMMCITNFTSTSRGENLARVVLENTETVETVLDNAIEVMREKGYLALNIDFENVLPTNREDYNRFIQRAVERLHPLGYSVSSALAPKISEQQRGVLYEAHDYAAHGRILDFVILMTYEWGWRGAPPQAISPLGSIRQVLDYAVTVIPRRKIMLGFQIYARDWLLPHRPGQRAETFSVEEARLLAVRYGASIQYDASTQSPFFVYRDAQGGMHEVWFEDARSAQAKFDLVKEYGLRGISYWALGYPFPQNWALLRENFSINKYI